MKKMLVLVPFTEGQKEKIITTAIGYETEFKKRKEIEPSELEKYSIIIGGISVDDFPYCKNLEWIQLGSAGYHGYIESGNLPKGIRMTNAVGTFGLIVAEHMMAMTLALMKNLHIYRDNMKLDRWKEVRGLSTLSEANVLVLGTGNLGSEYAKRVKVFGSKVIGVHRSDQQVEGFDECYSMDHLDELLPCADVIAIALPGSKSTEGLFDKEKFAKMKNGAIFINVGRGSIVDQPALEEALQEGRIRAGIDVTEPEPLPENDPLWNCEHLIITPHVAGGYRVPETVQKLFELSLYNLNQFLSDGDLRNEVNLK